MLSRFISRPSNLRLLTLLSSKSRFSNPNSNTPSPNPVFTYLTRHFSTNNNNNNNNNKNHSSSFGGSWNLSSENEDSFESLFEIDTEVPAQDSAASNNEENNNKDHSSSSGGSWNLSSQNNDSVGSIFGLDTEVPAQGLTTSNFIKNNNKDRSSSSGGSWNLSSQNDDSVGSSFGLDTEVPAQGSTTSNFIKNNNKDRSSSSGGSWNLSSQNDDSIGSIFGSDTEIPAQGSDIKDDSWLSEQMGKGDNDEIFKDGWNTAEGFTPWDLNEANEDKGEAEKLFDDGIGDEVNVSRDMIKLEEEKAILEKEEATLSAVLKGSKRAFGDLIESSGITDEMLDSLMALKDLQDIDGLPSLREIEDLRYEKNTKRSSRADIERQKQEEVANARVRKVDNKGRAYGTGRRKCSIARVWIEPGEGDFVINEKQFDVYFPMLDQRAALLRPFSETKTLGQWDVKCTVKGGGYTGQVGAIRLGISRALQNWEPVMRLPLKAAGFMTRDPRVVERKKPGKAKARKSFQWVKR